MASTWLLTVSGAVSAFTALIALAKGRYTAESKFYNFTKGWASRSWTSGKEGDDAESPESGCGARRRGSGFEILEARAN